MEADDNAELMAIAEDLAKDVFNNQQLSNEQLTTLIDAYTKRFLQAINVGYGIPSNREDGGMLQALSTNVYQFSAAKSYQQAKSLTEALLDEAGKLRTWSQFKAAALQINNEQVNQWLAAEYQNAIAASQMARKWQEIVQNKATLPYLKYVTANDGRVRPAHAAMDGITLPVDHQFWKTYYPPNGWGCRCLIIQLANAVVTKDTDINYPTDKDVPKIFRFNPGIEQQVFSKEHAYFKALPKENDNLMPAA
jgi:SPP1 gp7 family putative phage head morphogenesis protein